MDVQSYVKDKASVLLMHMAGLFFLSLFLKLSGNSTQSIAVIVVVWIFAVSTWLTVDCKRRKKLFKELFKLLEELDKPYLIAEVMAASPRLDDRLYREALRISNRSIIERVHELETAGRDYKEYIESWVHEVKLPLTAARLICENERGQKNRELLIQLDRIEKQVEQVLFYARMEQAYKDYLIHRVNLREVAAASVAANKNYFIQKGMQVSLELPENEPIYVSTDEKWVAFLLNQIFSNAIKYCKEERPLLRIYSIQGKQQISLAMEDNGMGIGKEDMGRIFDKGFTGKNGRNGKESTGIGLYLCKKLSDKLGLGIAAESKEGEYTRIILTFPESNLSKM